MTKKCLNCKIDIDLVGDFCSTNCNDEWQMKNQKCVECGKDIDLLEDEFKIKNQGLQDPELICMNCFNEKMGKKNEKEN